VAQELALSEGEPAWQRLLDRLPTLKSQFKQASACQPFRHMPEISFRTSTIAGKRWAMLPSAAGFVDPLLSTGFALTLTGIEHLAKIIAKHRDADDLAAQLQSYAKETDGNLMAASRLIGALYANMGDFSAFTALSLLYFSAVSFTETAHRLDKPELAPGFLLHRHPSFGPASRALLERAYKPDEEFAKEVQRLIEPFNVGGFGDPTRHNSYSVRAEDLLDARHKLGASREELVGMLERSGFFTQAPANR
jgi:FADH2 O2-dependent halogenase